MYRFTSSNTHTYVPALIAGHCVRGGRIRMRPAGAREALQEHVPRAVRGDQQESGAKSTYIYTST